MKASVPIIFPLIKSKDKSYRQMMEQRMFFCEIRTFIRDVEDNKGGDNLQDKILSLLEIMGELVTIHFFYIFNH